MAARNYSSRVFTALKLLNSETRVGLVLSQFRHEVSPCPPCHRHPKFDSAKGVRRLLLLYGRTIKA